jgi:hypothetical protein
MKKSQIIGLTLLIGGVILIYLYSAIQALRAIDIASVPLIILIGAIAIIIGIIALLISVIYEQTSDMKKRKEEIPEEDFKS